ncbi:MAG: septum site-determining protein MinC [Lachnospiraceae bacterium]|nr:septum site-determining protein MinC [Lachnospiraceae bacterium]
MSNAVVIKGTTYGFSVFIDEQADFTVICKELGEKFRESSKFFGDAKMAISFDGRPLSDEQQRQLLDIIAENSEVHIVCVIEHNTETEELHRRSLEDRLQVLEGATGQFYKGNLRSGQVLETETSIIIIGDVNQGATVTSKGNIIVLGALLGNVYAGAGGNQDAFIVALELDPVQIRIADTIARAPDREGKMPWKRSKEKTKEPKIAFRSGENIFIEPVSRTVLNDIKL